MVNAKHVVIDDTLDDVEGAEPDQYRPTSNLLDQNRWRR